MDKSDEVTDKPTNYRWSVVRLQMLSRAVGKVKVSCIPMTIHNIRQAYVSICEVSVTGSQPTDKQIRRGIVNLRTKGVLGREFRIRPDGLTPQQVEHLKELTMGEKESTADVT